MRYLSNEVKEAYLKEVVANGLVPVNFSNSFKFEGRDLVFMSETEPHIDDWPEDRAKTHWKIKFYAIDDEMVFIYRLNGQLHQVKPELDTIYEFEFVKYHALLHKDNVHLFHKRKVWEGWKPKPELACIFEFIED